MKGVDTRSTVRRQPWWRLVLPPVMVLIVVAGVLLVFVDARRDSISLDANLCPIDADDISGSIAFLFDFSKPLDAAQSGLPSGLLNEVSLRMARNQELNLFLLTGSQSGPRTLLKRMCKPYANEDLQIEAAKDQGGAVRDCNDLPAQLPADTREVATKFCAHLEAFAPRLDALARQDWPEERKVDNAYLIEALEDIRLELAERPEPLVIYVFSDMMQHADWYSHLDQDWSQWSHEEFAELMASQNWAIGDRLSVADWRVEVFYLPRRGLTDQPRVREVHQRFWREYFAGVELAFHVQAPGPPYSAVPLMNVLTEAEIAAQEREVVERLLREVREEQQELERQREETRRRLLEEQERLEQERDRLRLAELQQPAATPGGRDSEEPVPPEAAGGEGGEGGEGAAEDEGDAEDSGSPAEPSVSESAGAPIEEPPGVETEAVESSRAVAEVQPAPIEEPAREAAEPAPPTANQRPRVPRAMPVDEAPRACELLLSTDVVNRSPAYPRGGRMNLGSAVVTVRFVVDEQGETVDDTVAVVAGRSQADRERYFDSFTAEATATVRAWSFAFVEPSESDCMRRQIRTTSFKFEYAYR